MNIVISGFGTMGKVLLQEITNSANIKLVGIVDKVEKEGLQSFTDLTETVDTIIDFSHPSVLSELLDYAIANNIALVLATTNYTDSDLQQIQIASSQIPILQTGNTSVGVNLLLELVKEAAQKLQGFDIEIIEKHHNKKIDAPSGTATMLANEITSVKPLDKVYGRSGISKRNNNDLTIHAVRGGTVVGEHTVSFYGEDEVIEITHTAQSKSIFAKGAIKAAFFLQDKNNGLYQMKDVL